MCDFMSFPQVTDNLNFNDFKNNGLNLSNNMLRPLSPELYFVFSFLGLPGCPQPEPHTPRTMFVLASKMYI